MTSYVRKWRSNGALRKAWWIHVVERDPQGASLEVRQRAPKGAGSKEADDYEHAVRLAIRSGQWCRKCSALICRCAVAPMEVDQTVAEFSQVWQARNTRELEAGTVSFYNEQLKLIFPQLGAMLVKDVAFHHIEAFKAKLHEPQVTQRNGKTKTVTLSPTTINTVLRALRAMLKYAAELGKFGKDGRPPTVNLLDVEDGAGKYLSADQYTAVLNYVREHHQAWYPFFVVALATGLRIGELIALERRDIDLKNEVLHVNRVYYRKVFAAADSAARSIPLEDDALAVLKTMLAKPDLTNPFIFKGDRHKHITEASPRYVFQQATAFLKRAIAVDEGGEKFAGVEPYTRADNLTPHVLRHTFATRKVGEGVPLKVLADLMGHKSVTTTEIYARVTDDAKRAAMGKVKEMK